MEYTCVWKFVRVSFKSVCHCLASWTSLFSIFIRAAFNCYCQADSAASTPANIYQSFFVEVLRQSRIDELAVLTAPDYVTLEWFHPFSQFTILTTGIYWRIKETHIIIYTYDVIEFSINYSFIQHWKTENKYIHEWMKNNKGIPKRLASVAALNKLKFKKKMRLPIGK